MRFSTLTLASAASLLAIQSAQAALVEKWWTITYVDVNPDGLFDKRAIGVNGSWPLPIINVNSSDTVRIHVTNGLADGVGTALHAHGMFFNGTGYYDGAAMITQCPIPYNQTYSYDILNSPSSPEGRARQWGTFWAHSHVSGQYSDGFSTPNIIHADTTDITAHTADEEITVVLKDWYHGDYNDLMKDEFMNDNNPGGAEPIPDSALMFFANTPANSTEATWFPGFNENATLSWTPGKTYRLRIINMSSLAMFHFWIDGHELRIIEADGVDTEEYVADQVVISVAQRYSVLVTAKNATELDTLPTSNFMIHANMDPEMFDAVPDSLQLNITSNLIYDGYTSETTYPEETRDYDIFDDTVLVPFYPAQAYPPDVQKEVNVWFDTRSNGINYASFSNISCEPEVGNHNSCYNVSFIMPETPTLNTLVSMGDLALQPEVYGPWSNAFVYEHMDNIDLTVYNWDAGFHPFHLHGHQFQLVHKSMDALSTDESLNPPWDPMAVQTNPMRRDTVAIPSGGSVTLRFRADNPGAWLFHCHIAPHLTAGLAMVFIEGASIASQRITLPSYQTDQCSMSGISPTGNAVGLNSTTDFGYLEDAEVQPLVSGWTAKAVGSVVGCAITAALGLFTVILYGLGSKGDDDEDEEDDKDK